MVEIRSDLGFFRIFGVADVQNILSWLWSICEVLGKVKILKRTAFSYDEIRIKLCSNRFYWKCSTNDASFQVIEVKQMSLECE